jgi:hypothetical protein
MPPKPLPDLDAKGIVLPEIEGDEPQSESDWTRPLKQTAAMGLRIGGPMAGAALGTLIPIPGVGTVAGGAAGGALGEYLAEKFEPDHKGGTNLKKVGVNAAVGAIPGSALVKAGKPLVSGLIGAGMGAAQDVAGKWAEGENPLNPKNYGKGDLANIAMGGTLGAGFGWLHGRMGAKPAKGASVPDAEAPHFEKPSTLAPGAEGPQPKIVGRQETYGPITRWDELDSKFARRFYGGTQIEDMALNEEAHGNFADARKIRELAVKNGVAARDTVQKVIAANDIERKALQLEAAGKTEEAHQLRVDNALRGNASPTTMRKVVSTNNANTNQTARNMNATDKYKTGQIVQEMKNETLAEKKAQQLTDENTKLNASEAKKTEQGWNQEAKNENVRVKTEAKQQEADKARDLSSHLTVAGPVSKTERMRIDVPGEGQTTVTQRFTEPVPEEGEGGAGGGAHENPEPPAPKLAPGANVFRTQKEATVAIGTTPGAVDTIRNPVGKGWVHVFREGEVPPPPPEPTTPAPKRGKKINPAPTETPKAAEATPPVVASPPVSPAANEPSGLKEPKALEDMTDSQGITAGLNPRGGGIVKSPPEGVVLNQMGQAQAATTKKAVAVPELNREENAALAPVTETTYNSGPWNRVEVKPLPPEAPTPGNLTKMSGTEAIGTPGEFRTTLSRGLRVGTPGFIKERDPFKIAQDAAAERKATATAMAGAESAEFTHPSGRTALAGSDMSKPGTFRVTRFENSEPIGHTEHPTMESAVDLAVREGYAPKAPEATVEASATPAKGEVAMAAPEATAAPPEAPKAPSAVRKSPNKPPPASNVDTSQMTEAEVRQYYKQTAPYEDARRYLRDPNVSPELKASVEALLNQGKKPSKDQLAALARQWRAEAAARDKITGRPAIGTPEWKEQQVPLGPEEAWDASLRSRKPYGPEPPPTEPPSGSGNVTDRLKGDVGAINPMLAARLGSGVVGAGVGAATDDEHPVRGALIGGAAGLAAPSVISGLGKAIGSETGQKLVQAAPDWYRSALLMHPVNLPMNALAPWGSLQMQGLERMLAGKFGDQTSAELGKEILRRNKFSHFTDLFQKLEPEARDHLAQAAGRYGETFAENTPTKFREFVQFPAVKMTAGDLAAKQIGRDAGMNPFEAERATLTNEPYTPPGRGVTAFKKASKTEGGLKSQLPEYLMPFYRTATNQFEQGVERTPFLGKWVQNHWKDEPDNDAMQKAQQVLGGGVMAGSFGLGLVTPEVFRQPVNKFVSNFTGQYGLPAATAFAAGQAVRGGKNPIRGLENQMKGGDVLPLPSGATIANFINSGAQLSEGQVPSIPSGVVPGFLNPRVPLSAPWLVGAAANMLTPKDEDGLPEIE